MKHLLFTPDEFFDELSIAILIKDHQLRATELHKYYVSALSTDIPLEQLCAFSLKYEPSGKVSASVAKDYLNNNLLPALDKLGIKTVYVADATYFKYLTGKKHDISLGYVVPCSIKGYEHLNCIAGINYGQLFYNPSIQSNLDFSLTTVVSHCSTTHTDPGKDIIHSAVYYVGIDDTATMKLYKHPALTCDIETTSLRFDRGQIFTIAFAWDQHNGVAFKIEDEYDIKQLRHFFDYYTKAGTLLFHNALFDVKWLIYHVYMLHNADYINMRIGLNVFANVQDTMLYTYLALNSTADVKLGLKANSHEFTGNYALDDEAIHDVTKIPISDLLKYNLIDCLATWYVYNKYHPVCVADNQIEVYETIMQPSLKPLLEMMLMGLPLSLEKTDKARIKLEAVRDVSQAILMRQPAIGKAELQIRRQEMIKDNAKLKKKVKSISDYGHIRFNPNSPNQLIVLLYDVLALPVIDLTKTKQPATGQKTLAKLINHTDDPDIKLVLEQLIALAQSGKVLNDFITNFQELYLKRIDGTTWLNGDQVLGGTQSGRLSARNPNLANLPSNSIYGKTIKSCFVAPDGWLFGGADFNALEDRIGAILSKDKMKTLEFTQGFDGHSLRAIAFFSQLEEPVTVKGTFIDPEVVKQYDRDSLESVSAFKKEMSDVRQEAKAPSFALQYGGTWHTLVKNIGLPKDVSQAIEEGYHDLYSGLKDFAEEKTKFASRHGYVECAFGLRLRTPLLSQCILGTANTPREAESEARSAINAITQSWGMLSNRAAIAIQKRIEESIYRYQIFIVNQIHDAIYFLWQDMPEITLWLNQCVVEEMAWQDNPTIASDDVKLGAELDFGKSWDALTTIPNTATLDDIIELRTQLKE